MKIRLLMMLLICSIFGFTACSSKHTPHTPPTPPPNVGDPDKFDMKKQYGNMDGTFSQHQTDKFMEHLTPDFVLDFKKDPGTVFILDGVGSFLDAKGQAGQGNVMQKSEFGIRLKHASDAGDNLRTAPGNITVKGDLATVELLRVQDHGGMQMRYQGTDDWKKLKGVWRLSAIHLDDVTSQARGR